jgi:lipopolysaccharide export system protein LptA
MPLPVTRLRRWFAAAAILMIAIVAGMYFYARWRVRGAIHEVPARVGLDIQQTAEGFSISKSEQGRTEFTVSASKAVQFKEGGRAELHDVKIVVYGKDSSRFDRIAGDDFEFDPKSGNVTARGRVLIDLEANPSGIKKADQAPPTEGGKPIHVESDGLVFNKDTGNGFSTGKVTFETPEASGSAVGLDYVAKTGAMTLRSSVAMDVRQPQRFHLIAEHGIITKGPSVIVLDAVHLTRQNQQLQSDRATFFLRNDNTVERILAEGNVEGEVRARSLTKARSDRAELLLSGMRNQLTTAILNGNVHLETNGASAAQGDAGRATLYFGANQLLEKVHAEDGVRLIQNKSAQGVDVGNREGTSGKRPSATVAGAHPPAHPAESRGSQELDMTAPAMDFLVKNGNRLESAQTSGRPKIVITQADTGQKTVVTAGRFMGKFTAKNRLDVLHGEPDARIVSSTPGQADRISTSPTLDVRFAPEGGISSITQAGGVTYVNGTQKGWAQTGTYTAADQMLVLNGSSRVVDGGMTTTAEKISFNRATGDAVAVGDVKSTYSDLKAQPDGAMLASSDPIHVVSQSMTAHRSAAVAVYSGDARLWQNSNVVEAPTLQFDRDHRSLVAEGTPTQLVKTVLVQIDSKTGKATPVTITSAHLTYTDSERKAQFEGGVSAKGADANGAYAKMTSREMTVFMVAQHQSQVEGAANARAGTQVEKILAQEDVVLTQPGRRATGEKLVYTSAEDKFEITGGPPCIFDAEHGKITGDSLTFFRHDDRVLVEGRETSPAVTRTQVAR